MKLEIADIATNERKLLKGFKVLGIFPFYLRYITTGTHIKLCKIKEEIELISPSAVNVSDYYDSSLQERILPLINRYCVTALVNDRFLGWFFKFLLNFKINRCGHYHIFNLFFTIYKLDEPSFFLAYWKTLRQKENMLLKEEKHS